MEHILGIVEKVYIPDDNKNMIVFKIRTAKELITLEEEKNEFVNIDIDIHFNDNIAEGFFDFNANLLSSYSKYLNFLNLNN